MLQRSSADKTRQKEREIKTERERRKERGQRTNDACSKPRCNLLLLYGAVMSANCLTNQLRATVWVTRLEMGSV